MKGTCNGCSRPRQRLKKAGPLNQMLCRGCRIALNKEAEPADAETIRRATLAAHNPAALVEELEAEQAAQGDARRRPFDMWLPDGLLAALGRLSGEVGADTQEVAERLLWAGVRLFPGMATEAGYRIAMDLDAHECNACEDCHGCPMFCGCPDSPPVCSNCGGVANLGAET